MITNRLSVDGLSVQTALLSFAIAYVQIGVCAGGVSQLSEFSNSTNAVHYFCDCALLVDRGVANTPFVGSADQWILRQIERSEEVRDYLKINAEQLATLAHGEARHTPRPPKVVPANPLSIDNEQAMAARDRLVGLLNHHQREKLSVIYLNVEGMMALRRRHFREVIGISANQQTEIVKLSRTYLDGSAMVVHRGIFTLQNEELHKLPMLNLKLRELSAELDHKIASKLTEEQRVRLVALLIEALHNTEVIQCPGVGRPWHMNSSFRQSSD